MVTVSEERSREGHKPHHTENFGGSNSHKLITAQKPKCYISEQLVVSKRLLLMKRVWCLLAVLTVCNSAHPSLFDRTDYSTVENIFSKSEPIRLLSFVPNAMCLGKIETKLYSKRNDSTPHSVGRPYVGLLQSLGRAIAWDMRGRFEKKEAFRAKFEGYVEYLVTAAQDKYFTKNKWIKNGASPAYAQTMILINLSFFVNYMDLNDLWKKDQREEVIAWGREIYERSHYDHYSNGKKPESRWPDTVSKAAAAYMLWGVATKDIKIFKDGYRDFLSLHKKIQSDGAFKQHIMGPYAGVLDDSKDLYLEAKTIGDIVLAAYAGELVGMNSFSIENDKGGNVQKLVSWLDQISYGKNNLRQHKGSQDIRHLSNQRGDSLSWMSIYRLMDKKDNLELVNAHLEFSLIPGAGYGYDNSKMLTCSRCLANEVSNQDVQRITDQKVMNWYGTINGEQRRCVMKYHSIDLLGFFGSIEKLPNKMMTEKRLKGFQACSDQ